MGSKPERRGEPAAEPPLLSLALGGGAAGAAGTPLRVGGWGAAQKAAGAHAPVPSASHLSARRSVPAYMF